MPKTSCPVGRRTYLHDIVVHRFVWWRVYGLVFASALRLWNGTLYYDGPLLFVPPATATIFILSCFSWNWAYDLWPSGNDCPFSTRPAPFFFSPTVFPVWPDKDFVYFQVLPHSFLVCQLSGIGLGWALFFLKHPRSSRRSPSDRRNTMDFGCLFWRWHGLDDRLDPRSALGFP